MNSNTQPEEPTERSVEERRGSQRSTSARVKLCVASLTTSPLGFIISVNVGLIAMSIATVVTLIALGRARPEEASAQARARLWWAWAVHLLALSGVYMVTYGVANIVGSGRYKSARMAVSTLRTMHWAERQCVKLAGRPCTLEELNGSREVAGKRQLLLRSGFKTLSDTPHGPVASVGLYHYALYPVASNPVTSTPATSTSATTAEPVKTYRAPRWVLYAWPRTDSTIQSFCLDEYEEILELPISPTSGSLYLGLERAPAPDACLGALHREPNPPLTQAQKDAKARGKKPPPSTHQGADNHTWQRWRGKRTRYARSRDASRLR